MILRKTFVYLEIIIVFCLPVIFIYSGLLDFRDRFFMAVCIFLYVISIVLLEKWSFKDCGFPWFKKIFNWWKQYLSFTIILFIIAYIFWKNIWNIVDFSTISYNYFNPLYLFMLCFTQEFVYRVFLIYKLESLTKNRHIIVIVSSLVFALLHIMFVPLYFVLWITFIAWMLWWYLYLARRNIILLTLSHMLLNWVATYFCLIQGFPGCV